MPCKWPSEAVVTADPPPPYAGRRPTRTPDGAVDIVVDPPIVRATAVATGDVYELAVDDAVARRVCPRVGDAAGLLALVERAGAVAVSVAAPPTDGRLRAVYELRVDVARLSLVVRPADPVLDSQYGATLELPIVRRASDADALAILRRDQRAEHEVLVARAGRLERVHASDLADDQWSFVSAAPVRLTRDLVVDDDLDDLSGVAELVFLRTVRLARVVDIQGIDACKYLQKVDISSDRFVDPAALALLPRLVEVRLTACTALVDASALTGCVALTSLDVSLCARLARLPGPPLLRRLVARGCTALTDLGPLTRTDVWHGSVLASAPRDHVPFYEPMHGFGLCKVAHMMSPADVCGLDKIMGSTARPPTAAIEATLRATPVYAVAVGFANASPHCNTRGPGPHTVGTKYPDVCLRLVLEQITSSRGWPQAIGQTDGQLPHGPELVGRLANVSVDLVDTSVTRDNLKVLVAWYESRSDHGAIVRLHDVRVSSSPHRAHHVLPDWVDALPTPVHETDLFVPPVGRDDYLVDVHPLAAWHREIVC